MTELEKFKLINQCETPDELTQAVLDISEDDIIVGRSKSFNATSMSRMVLPVIQGIAHPNYLTREFGIRQQALYIKFYLNA